MGKKLSRRAVTKQLGVIAGGAGHAGAQVDPGSLYVKCLGNGPCNLVAAAEKLSDPSISGAQRSIAPAHRILSKTCRTTMLTLA